VFVCWRSADIVPKLIMYYCVRKIKTKKLVIISDGYSTVAEKRLHYVRT
jgi:hypothetical protein